MVDCLLRFCHLQLCLDSERSDDFASQSATVERLKEVFPDEGKILQTRPNFNTTLITDCKKYVTKYMLMVHVVGIKRHLLL